MADQEEKDQGMNPVEKELVEENPAQTIVPPQIKLQQKPIPNPNLNSGNK